MRLNPTASAPLIVVAEYAAGGGDPRDLRRACRQGLLRRVRRGIYVYPGDWDAATPRDRHVIAIRAAVLGAQPPFLVAGRSAAALWDLPGSATWPDDVTLLVPYRGGGTSEPGVRRTSASASRAARAEIDGIPVTTIGRTALDVARSLDFIRAVAVMDRALWHRNPNATTVDAVRSELRSAAFTRGGAHLGRVVDFASHLSDSPGESKCRATIHELGFEVPELQVRFTDQEGDMVTDYLWREAGVAGEFDGKVKYTRDEFTGGDPGETVWREKKREDRLRRQVRTVVRIFTSHVSRPRALAKLLDEAGVPRRGPGYVPRDLGAPPSLTS